MTKRIHARLGGVVLAVTLVTACEERLSPNYGGIRRPPIVVAAGTFDAITVNDSALPHVTTQAGVTYSTTSGSFQLNGDSTWFFSMVTVHTADDGTAIGTFPVNSSGTWTATDTTLNLSPSSGRMRVKGDTLFWRGGPRRAWEDTLTYAMVRR